MAISKKTAEQLRRASWIRRMFEEGVRLKQEYGAENVFDFMLGNPSLPLPQAFTEQLPEDDFAPFDTRPIRPVLRSPAGTRWIPDRSVLSCTSDGSRAVRGLYRCWNMASARYGPG